MTHKYRRAYYSTFSFLAIIMLILMILNGCATQKPNSKKGELSVINNKITADSLNIPETPREFRAVWVATVANIDWPSERGLPVKEQKDELIGILDRAASMNMNAVIFQVRPHADAMYNSHYEPWSAYLTGQMGKAPKPYYDPLEFAVEEAHKRGLELHAWFNPYRAHSPSDTSKVSENHISRTDPELVLQYGQYQWLDPGLEEVQELSRNVIMDVVKRYDVDGIHLDDYFYPYPSYAGGKEFPDSLSWQKALAKNPDLNRNDWRRENVNEFIKTVYQSIKKVKPYVKFGISPFGTWQPGYPERTGGFNAYTQLYADSRLWLRKGWVDYFTPQIYNQIGRLIRPFPVMLDWWTDQNWQDRHIWPGLYTSRAVGEEGWPTEEINGQIYIARGQSGVTGTVHFSMQSLLPEWNSLVRDVTAAPYALPALIPASPWLDNQKPNRPSVKGELNNDKLVINFNSQSQARWRTNWSRTNNKWELDIIPGMQKKLIIWGSEASHWPELIAVSAVDRIGNKSSPQIIKLSKGPESTARDKQSENDKEISKNAKRSLNIIKRSEWGPRPAGIAANAVRKNLSEGGVFKFRDLELKLQRMIPANDTSASNNNGSPPDSVRLFLSRNEVSEVLQLAEGHAINWNGYHIDILAANTNKDVLAGGLAEFEVATVSSLPIVRSAAKKVGGAQQRLKIPHKITQITLHHTGSPQPLTADDDPIQRLKNLYEWGVESRNWWDIPYHYLIGLDGTIYEGRDARYAGDTNTTYDTRGHLLIAVMGNYNKQEPTSLQIESISQLMGWAVKEYKLTAEDISAHYKEADTGCPGKTLR